MYSTYQHAYPKYGLATVILALLFIGVPALLTTLDPGGGEDLTLATAVLDSNENNVTLTVPAGWERTDLPGIIVLRKGTVAIEVQTRPWSGTPAELYKDHTQQLEQVVKLVSAEDPVPTDPIAGMAAVTGMIHTIVDGQDNSAITTVASDGTTGLVTDISGPLLDVQSHKDVYQQVLTTITFSETEAGQ